MDFDACEAMRQLCWVVVAFGGVATLGIAGAKKLFD